MAQFLSIPFAKPDIGPEEEEAVLRVLRSGWLTTGKETLEFEREFADLTGVPWALAVNSATSGLHLAIEALGVGKDDLVAVCPYTFTASCEVMRYVGAHPLFIDCAPGTFHMDPKKLEAVLESRQKSNLALPKAIMPVHIGGFSPAIEEIYEIARHFGIKIIDDAAHAFPARHQDSDDYLGTRADISVYSFYANKTITTGEGGMVIGHNEELAKRIKIMRSHGIDRDVWHRFTSQAKQWQYAVVEPGFKYNLPDILASLGREQLKKADLFMKNRRELVALYHEGLKDCPHIDLPPLSDQAKLGRNDHSWHLFTVRLKGPKKSEIRDQMIGQLTEEGIGSSVHYIPLHIMPYYEKTYNLKPQDFPTALSAFEGALSLPLFSGLSKDSVERVIRTVLKLLKSHYD